MIYLLAALGGFSQALDMASNKNMGDQYSIILIVIIALLAGGIAGINSDWSLGFYNFIEMYR